LKTNLPQRRQERKGLAAKTMLTCLVKTQIRRFVIQNLDFPLLLRVFAVEVLFQLRFLGLCGRNGPSHTPGEVGQFLERRCSVVIP
jgi:hypothetical protein